MAALVGAFMILLAFAGLGGTASVAVGCTLVGFTLGRQAMLRLRELVAWLRPSAPGRRAR